MKLRMESLEQHNAEFRAEIDDLKSRMTKFTEMMQVIMARTDPLQRTVISEVGTTIVEPPQTQNVATTWPEFGLPRNYSPQYEINHEVGQFAQQTVQMPVVTEQRPIIHTITQVPFGNHFTYQADGSQNGDQVQNDEVKEKYNAI